MVFQLLRIIIVLIYITAYLAVSMGCVDEIIIDTDYTIFRAWIKVISASISYEYEL